MEKVNQTPMQQDAESRIQALSAVEISAVSGGQGPNRFLGAARPGPSTSLGKGDAITSVKQIFTGR